MLKETAIKLLGGNVAAAAKTLGVTSSAISQWPEELTPQVIDRLIAHYVRNRKRVPAELLASITSKA